LGAKKKVAFDRRFCPTVKGGKKCSGMWVLCGIDGKHIVQCIF
jgi:hypothetical protein